MDNRCLEQAAFNNSNINARVKNKIKTGYKLMPMTPDYYKLMPMTPDYYKLPQNLKLKIYNLYKGEKFIEEEAIEELI